MTELHLQLPSLPGRKSWLKAPPSHYTVGLSVDQPLILSVLVSINSGVIQGLTNNKDTLVSWQIPKVLEVISRNLGQDQINFFIICNIFQPVGAHTIYQALCEAILPSIHPLYIYSARIALLEVTENPTNRNFKIGIKFSYITRNPGVSNVGFVQMFSDVSRPLGSPYLSATLNYVYFCF